MVGSQAGPQGAMKKSNAGDEAFSQDPDKVFNECPDMLYHSNLLVVAKKYTTKQIAERDTKILQKTRPQATVKSNTIVARIKSACNSMAKEKGVSPKSFRQEFDVERSKIEGALIPYSLRTFKFVPTTPLPADPKSFDDLKAYKKEIDDKNLSHPLEFSVKVYLVYQNYLKNHHYDHDKALDEIFRVFGFKSKDSAHNFISNVTKAALDRNGNLVNWKTAEGLNKGKARAEDANAKASTCPTQVAAIPSAAQAQVPRALNSSREAMHIPVQDPRTQSRPNVFELAGSAGAVGRPFPSMGLISHPDPRPPPTLLQQNAPFGGQPTFLHPHNQVSISGVPQNDLASYKFPAYGLDALRHQQSQPHQTASLQEQGTQTNGYAPTGDLYYGNWHTTFTAAAIPTSIPTAITTANYAAAQPASNFWRHEAPPVSATPKRILDVPTHNGAIVPPSAHSMSSSEDVQLRNAGAFRIGRVLPKKVINNNKKKLNDPLRSRLLLFLEVLNDPNHIHHEEFDFNTFAHMITIGEANDLQETVKDITDFHKHLETKTGDLRSKYTDEQIRKVAADAVRHFMDSEYEKGAYFIKYFLNVLAKFDELVELAGAHEKEIQEESAGKSRDGDEEKRDEEGGFDPQKVADSMDIDDAGEVDAGENGSGGADEQNEDAVGGDDGADPMEIDEA